MAEKNYIPKMLISAMPLFFVDKVDGISGEIAVIQGVPFSVMWIPLSP